MPRHQDSKADWRDLPLFHTTRQSDINEGVIENALPETDFSKYIVYVDESGDHNLTSLDENYPIFVLAFCVFHKRHYSEVIVPAIEKFKFNIFGHDQVVLHEREIRQHEGEFKFLRDETRYQSFQNNLSEIIKHSNFILISATIDKKRIQKVSSNSNAYHIALKLCMEKLYAFLHEKDQHGKKTHIVVERRGKKEDQELELEFRRICDGQNSWGINLPFDIKFAHKQVSSSGLQLADLVARPIGLRTLRPTQDNRAFEALGTKFYCGGGRESVGDNYEGVGMLIYPDQKSERPQ